MIDTVWSRPITSDSLVDVTQVADVQSSIWASLPTSTIATDVLNEITFKPSKPVIAVDNSEESAAQGDLFIYKFINFCKAILTL